MGLVYKAEDTKLGRTVALKFLTEESARNRVALKRLLREARTASSLNHPNICTVYEVAEAGHQTFIAMEYVEGRALSALIPAEGLPADRVLRYGRQIAEALAHSHDHGVAHRDLKSSNVMVTPDGRIKVLDFGLAKRFSEAAGGQEPTRTQESAVSQPGLVVGTFAYMSPEALRGGPADARSDIWSFGVVLYEMCTGALPFRGKSLFELTAAVLNEPSPELPARTGPGVRAILGRCLAREPAERYQRGGELRAAIESLESGSQLIPAAPPPHLSRRKWLWAGAGAAALAAAGAVAALWPRRRRGYAPPPSRVPEANDYLRRALVFLSAQQDLPRARQLLEKSLALDPKFAYARAWYGFSHVLLIDSGLSSDTGWLYKAEEELRRALQLDPNSVRAHAGLALTYLYEGRKDLLLQEARKIIELDPGEPDGPNMLACYHHFNGDIQAARALWKKALELDPLFFPARWNMGDTLRQLGDAEGSIREQEKVLEQDPKNVSALLLIAMAQMNKGDVGKAREALERAQTLEPQNVLLRISWALQLALEGKRPEALRQMDGEMLKYGEFVWLASLVAEFYAVLGDKPKAMDWLERAVRAGDERAEWFRRDPLLANVRGEPRFRQILDSISFRRQQRAH